MYINLHWLKLQLHALTENITIPFCFGSFPVGCIAHFYAMNGYL